MINKEKLCKSFAWLTEYTLCGNAIPDSAMEYEGAERVDEGFCGSIRDVTCADCINKITYIRSLK